MKKIILLEFKRTSDYSESYYRDVDRGWTVEVVPLVTGQRSVKEKEWMKSFRVFGIDKDDDKKILRKLGLTLLNEHEKLFSNH